MPAATTGHVLLWDSACVLDLYRRAAFIGRDEQTCAKVAVLVIETVRELFALGVTTTDKEVA